MFQRRGATSEKARFLVFSFWASLGVRLLSLTSWLARVIRVDLGGRRRSTKYRGPKPFRALYVSINTLKLIWLALLSKSHWESDQTRLRACYRAYLVAIRLVKRQYFSSCIASSETAELFRVVGISFNREIRWRSRTVHQFAVMSLPSILRGKSLRFAVAWTPLLPQNQRMCPVCRA